MKLNKFDERIHSLIIFSISITGILFYFFNRNFIWNLPVFIFLLISFFINKVELKKIILVVVGAFIFSFFCSYFIVFFPNELMHRPPFIDMKFMKVSEVLFWTQFKVFLRIGFISSISFLSLFAINFEKLLVYFLEKKWMSAKLGYPLLLAFNSVSLLRAEYQKIQINAKFRNISLVERWNTLFPLLVFAIRHADRGAMSLITRGLNENKSYYFEVKLMKRDLMVFIGFLILLIFSMIKAFCH